MSQMTGADIGDLERGAGNLDSIGNRIGSMARPLRAQLYSSHWHGAAADRFRREWDAVHGPALKQAEDFLRNAVHQLRREADEQRRASDAGGGGRGASTGAPVRGGREESNGGGVRAWLGDRARGLRTAAQLSASAVAQTGLLAPLVLGLAVGTGNSIEDTKRILFETAVNVLDEGDLLSDRQRAFVRMTKLVPIIGAATAGAGLVGRGSDVLIDFVRYGPGSDEFRAGYADLMTRSVDVVTDTVITDAITWVPQALVLSVDLVSGRDYASRVQPSYWLNDGVDGLVEGAF